MMMVFNPYAMEFNRPTKSAIINLIPSKLPISELHNFDIPYIVIPLQQNNIIIGYANIFLVILEDNFNSYSY